MTESTTHLAPAPRKDQAAKDQSYRLPRKRRAARPDRRADWSIAEEGPLFPKVKVASSFFKRMRGLLGSPPQPQLLMIAPCHSIHTYGMRYPIHVAFFDQRGTIIQSERAVPPGTKRSCDNACGVLEMPAVFANDQWFSSGDHLRLAPPEASRP